MRRIGVVFGALMLLQACGGGGSPTGPSLAIPAPAASAPPLPAPPVGATILYTGTFTVGPSNGARGTFAVPGAGLLTTSVTWDAPGATVVATLTDERCESLDGALSGACFNLGQPDRSASRPKTFSVPVGGAMRAHAWVGNVGSASGSGTLRVAYTPAPAAPPTATPAPRPTPTPTILTCDGATVPALVECLNDQGIKPPTALCRDGRYSCSTTRSGTCSSHGGVSCWVCPGPLC